MKKNNTLLTFGLFTSNIGTSIYLIFLSFWVLEIEKNPLKLSIVMSSAYIPRMILTPLVGPIIDRFQKKSIIIISDIVAGLSMILFSVLLYFNFYNFNLLIFLTVVVGLSQDFFTPAFHSLLPIVYKDKNDLKNINSNISMAKQLSDVIGKSSAGFLYASLSSLVFFFANGISFFISALCEFFIDSPEKKKTQVAPLNTRTIISSNLEGLRYIFNDKSFLKFFILVWLINMFGYSGFFFLIPYFKDSLELGPQFYGIAMAIYSLGNIIGIFLYKNNYLNKISNRNLFFNSFILMSIIFSQAPTLISYKYLLFLAFVLCGIFNGIPNLITNLIFQSKVPTNIQGRVFSFRSFFFQGSVPLCLSISGYLASIYQPDNLIKITFMLTAVVSILFYICFTKNDNIFE